MSPENNPTPTLTPAQQRKLAAKAHQHRHNVLTLSFLVLVIAAAFGFYSWNSGKGGAAETSYESASEEMENADSMEGDNPVAGNDFTGWQTYHNEEYGFELEYPNNWQSDDSESACGGLPCLVAFSDGRHQDWNATVSTYHMSYEEVRQGSIFSRINQDTEIQVAEENILIGTNTWTKLTVTEENSSNPFIIVYLSEHLGDTYQFSHGQYLNDPSPEQILSTFRFLD